jgi:ferredoxin
VSKTMTFELDGRLVEAAADDTIWQVAKRFGTRIPHLCYLDEPDYRPDGNCRACMVEIEGERVARKMMEEAEKIARRIGASFRVDIERRINGAASVGAHRTSMLQDLEKSRPIELDALLTAVQEMGQLVNMETPTIETVLALAKQVGRVAKVYPTYPEAMMVEERAGAAVD